MEPARATSMAKIAPPATTSGKGQEPRSERRTCEARRQKDRWSGDERDPPGPLADARRSDQAASAATSPTAARTVPPWTRLPAGRPDVDDVCAHEHADGRQDSPEARHDAAGPDVLRQSRGDRPTPRRGPASKAPTRAASRTTLSRSVSPGAEVQEHGRHRVSDARRAAGASASSGPGGRAGQDEPRTRRGSRSEPRRRVRRAG